MLICSNCNKEFNTSVIIDGERKSLSKRKYCLECVPYGKRTIYRGKIVIPEDRYREREFICLTCGKVKKNKSRNNECSSCRNKRTRIERKIAAIKKKGGACQICGYNKYIGSLDFHHTGEQKKEDSLSRLFLHSMERIEKELKKCILLCRNCHGEVHGGVTSI